MKLLQVIVAVLTVLLFLAKQNVFAGVCPFSRNQVKARSLTSFWTDSLSSTSVNSSHTECARGPCGALTASLSLPKHKKDPKISVDNEDIDCRPVE